MGKKWLNSTKPERDWRLDTGVSVGVEGETQEM